MDKVKFLFLFLISVYPALSFTQVSNAANDTQHKYATAVVQGDTVPVMCLDQVSVWGSRSLENSAEARRWDRLVRNVKIAYPYAKLAGIKFEEYSKELEQVKSEKEKKLMMKQAEDELQAQFGEELKQLTFTQGKILIKLIDRQTSNSSYDILKEFRGRFVAFFWQGIGKIFGYNLKTKYDPLNEDADIERIVLMIENGTI